MSRSHSWPAVSPSAQPACSPSRIPARDGGRGPARARTGGKTAAGTDRAAADPAPRRVYSPVAQDDHRAPRARARARPRATRSTTANVRSPNDPEVVRARKTVERLAGLMARIDTVLVEAVDEFPTMFDFSNDSQIAAQPPAADRATTHRDLPDRKPEQRFRGRAAATTNTRWRRLPNELEWSSKMHEKGYRQQSPARS